MSAICSHGVSEHNTCRKCEAEHVFERDIIHLKNKVVDAVRQCGVHGAVHLPSGNCPQEMEGCQSCPIDNSLAALDKRIKKGA